MEKNKNSRLKSSQEIENFRSRNIFIKKKIEKSMLTLSCDSITKKAGEFDH